LALSFKLAAAADPEADLYYNDYSLTGEAKRKGVIRQPTLQYKFQCPDIRLLMAK